MLSSLMLNRLPCLFLESQQLAQGDLLGNEKTIGSIEYLKAERSSLSYCYVYLECHKPALKEQLESLLSRDLLSHGELDKLPSCGYGDR